MAETMTGGRTLTFAELEKDLNSRSEQPPAQPDPPPPAQPSNQDNPPPAQPENNQLPANPEQPEASPETNVSDFPLSLGDEKPQDNPPPVNQPPTFNWKEELKKLPIDEVAAELGFDPFAVELNKHIKGGGQAVDYLQARAIDYNKVSDDALLKDDLRKQYPTLTPQQVDLMFNRKYGVAEDALDDDKEFVLAQKTADAYRIRQSAIENQSKFKISDTPIPQKDEAYEQWKQYKEQQSQQVEMRNNFYSSHDATKKLNESKRVTISLGDGVAPFSWTVNQPELITRAFTDDGQTFKKLLSTPQGEPDVVKQQLTTLFMYNPQKFIQDVFNYGKSMGVQKELVDEGRNAQKPQAIVAGMKNESNKAVPTGVSTFAKSASR